LLDCRLGKGKLGLRSLGKLDESNLIGNRLLGSNRGGQCQQGKTRGKHCRIKRRT
jgi:hypothetical protein